MTPARRTAPARSRRAGHARAPFAQLVRVAAAAVLGALAGLALGLGLLVKATASADASPPRDGPSATPATPSLPATVASVIAPADPARAASAQDRTDPAQGRP